MRFSIGKLTKKFPRLIHMVCMISGPYLVSSCV